MSFPIRHHHSTRRSLSLAILNAVVIWSLASCGDKKADELAGEKGAVLTRSLSGQPGSLDPQRAEDVFYVASLTGQPLDEQAATRLQQKLSGQLDRRAAA